jgi:hypothetical protein
LSSFFKRLPKGRELLQDDPIKRVDLICMFLDGLPYGLGDLLALFVGLRHDIDKYADQTHIGKEQDQQGDEPAGPFDFEVSPSDERVKDIGKAKSDENRCGDRWNRPSTGSPMLPEATVNRGPSNNPKDGCA